MSSRIQLACFLADRSRGGAARRRRKYGISAGAVYVAKSRVLARIKTEVEAMQRQEEA